MRVQDKRKKKLLKKVNFVNENVEKIENIVERVVKQEVIELQKLIDEIELEQARCEAERISIDKSKLENWVIKLPIVMDNLAWKLEQRSIDKDIAEAILSENWDKAMLNVNGKVNEQKSKANLSTVVDSYVAIVKKAIYKRIDSKLKYADKIFYGVKAVLGGRL
jgi:hypothetical protein